MTDLHIPTHITLTRQIAQQEAAAVTRLALAETQLKTQLDEHQRDAAAERDRIEAELLAAREKAEKHLEALAETGRRLTSELQGIGRQLQQHHDEATEAQQTVLGWCTRQGIDPADLPPLRDTGPMPAIPATEESDAVLAMGARMADPNATQVDAGGDQPESTGPFQGGDTGA